MHVDAHAERAESMSKLKNKLLLASLEAAKY